MSQGQKPPGIMLDHSEIPRMSALDPLADDLAFVLEQTAGWWESIRGQNLFITGGTGFFGRWLLETFAFANTTLRLEATLVVMSRDPGAFLRHAPVFGDHPAIRFVMGDVRGLTAEGVRRQLGPTGPHGFNHVIHAATDTSATVQAADPYRLLDTIVQGTRAALDFALATGAKRFLLTSSGAVYGRQPGVMTHVPEHYSGAPDCTVPASAYGEGKRHAELLCACYHQQHGLETLIARCFAFVGPHLPLDAHFAIGNFIQDALRGGPVRVSGDGTPFRSYLYAADLAVWLWTILWKAKPARPYNVGSGEAVSIVELAHTISRTLEIVEPPLVASAAKPGMPPARYVPNVERAEAELGLRVRFTLADAIEKTVRWAAAHDSCIQR